MREEKPVLKIFSLRLPQALAAKLERLGERHHRSMHGETVAAVAAWVRKHTTKKKGGKS